MESAQVAQVAQRGVGNTKTPRKRGRNWQITINNPTLEDDTKIRGLEKFIFQYEQGEKGTIHIQGMIGYKNPVSFESIKKILPTAHIEMANNYKALLEYCKKSETSISRYWQIGFETSPLKIITELRPWQQELINDINFDDDRSIHWYYDTNGNIGKTAIAKYICTKYNAIYLSGSSADMKFAVSTLQDKKNLICVFGFVRQQEGKISYAGIEQIKDGIFFSGKYESNMCIYDPPHIICLANFAPDTTMLSTDRLKITDLTVNMDCNLKGEEDDLLVV